MDSVTQFALGAAVAGAVLGPRTRPWRALLWGGVVGTLPDLDVLIDHGDAVQNMISHRAESHALFWQTLAAPVLAAAIAALHRERRQFGRWCAAVWLVLVTHALLDAMTIYGTRLLLPFVDAAFGTGSLFVVDPLYTLPLLVGALRFGCDGGGPRGRRWNHLGLLLSTLYAGWSLFAQQQALGAAHRSLRDEGIAAERVLATAAPLQTVLWRLLAATPDHLYEAHWSPFDGGRPVVWTRIERGREHLDGLEHSAAVAGLAAQSQGFWKAWREGDELRLADVRMGLEPHYVFTFVVGRAGSPVAAVDRPTRVGARIELGRGLAWLGRRMFGEPLPPPR
ncbi:MAG: metal-dependent hydrolase [Planctomycetes bacterium]|nr:metal-dependent hydrolase [Planctomycetota bacterium]